MPGFPPNNTEAQGRENSMWGSHTQRGATPGSCLRSSLSWPPSMSSAKVSEVPDPLEEQTDKTQRQGGQTTRMQPPSWAHTPGCRPDQLWGQRGACGACGAALRIPALGNNRDAQRQCQDRPPRASGEARQSLHVPLLGPGSLPPTSGSLGTMRGTCAHYLAPHTGRGPDGSGHQPMSSGSASLKSASGLALSHLGLTQTLRAAQVCETQPPRATV
ncbi:uncharacterized protein LOC125108475 isoform X3 [Lutra lutra]|uniref:uncharacterized protein LOC125108475 isoform X3 n=1 Tax=Lutra lutra TaxID=9657 RepID=UPI001FD2CEE0|nr:uncharacterized protein LOC125108475 isoform X3 [Lutra lutra]